MNQDCEPLLFSLPPEQFALLASLIGVLLSYGLDTDKQNSLGYFFSSIGQTLQTIATQGVLLESESKDNMRIDDKINKLKEQINLLEQEINGYRK